MLILSHKGLDNSGGIVFQGFLFNVLELNHAFLSQGCTRQRRGQMEPSSPPHHTWAGASLSAVPRGVCGALAAPAAPSRARGSALHHPQAGMAVGANVPSIAGPCVRAPPPSLQRLAHPSASIHALGSADILACCRQPLSG